MSFDFKNFHDILEIIYFLTAGPILLYVAFRGLQQIKVAKESTRINSKRDAFRIAAEQCNVFKDKVIPLFQEVNKEIKEKDVKFFSKFVVNFDGKGIQVKLKEEITEEDITKMESIANLTELFNIIEGYALYFASGVADEKVGYITTGKAFCNIVEQYIVIIVPEFKKGYYKNISILFSIWHNRLMTDKLLLDKAEIDKKIKANQTITIPAIGTLD